MPCCLIWGHMVVQLKSPKKLPKRAFKEQIFIYYLLEAPIRTSLFSDLRQFGNYFNLTISYLNDSRTDIILPHGKIVPRLPSATYTKPNISVLQMKDKMAAWIVSNCRWVRIKSAPCLCRRIIEAYSSGYLRQVWHTKMWERKLVPHQNSQTLLFLSCFWQFRLQGLSYREDLQDSAVWHRPYSTWRCKLQCVFTTQILHKRDGLSLTETLGRPFDILTQNRTAYLEYFKWKETQKSLSLKSARIDSKCKLCEILHDSSYRFKSGFDVYDYWYGGGPCVEGKSEARLLGLYSNLGIKCVVKIRAARELSLKTTMRLGTWELSLYIAIDFSSYP